MSKKYALTKIAATVLALFLLLPVTAFAGNLTPTYDFLTYTVTDTPSSLVINYYTDVLSRGFTWFTDTSVEETDLRVLKGSYAEGDVAFDSAEAITGKCSSVCDENANPDLTVNVHKAQIEGLEAGTEYSYRVGGNGKYIYGSFTTDSDDGKVTVLSLSDTQTKNFNKLNYVENTLANAAATTPDGYDFIAFGGDMFDTNAGNSDQSGNQISRYLRWGITLDTFSTYFGSTPLANVCGNHDNSDVSQLVESVTNIDRGVKLTGILGGCYSFDNENLHYVALGYTYDTTGELFGAYTAWLESDLKAANENPDTDWIVVILHRGLYTTGDHCYDDEKEENGENRHYIETLAGLFSKYHVDLVLQGHDHTYSKTEAYLWDSTGCETALGSSEVVLTEPKMTEIDGEEYYVCPNGTFYVSPGCAGHRIGENTGYADPENGLYKENYYKAEIGEVAVDSEILGAGTLATGDLNVPMYCVLTVEGDRLTYDFYVSPVTEDSEGILIDRLNITKDETLGSDHVPETTASKETDDPFVNKYKPLKDDDAKLIQPAIIVGGIAVIVIAVAWICVCIRRKKSKKD